MTERTGLGELEQLILLAIARLGDDAYAVSIIEEIGVRANRKVSHASIYVVLNRLEEKGLLRSRLGEPSAERGGRSKRFYVVTPLAIKKLREARHALLSLWDGLTTVTGRGGE